MLKILEDVIYAGTATPSSGGGGGGGGDTPTVEITNSSSSAISTGDKVWISPSGGSLEAIDFNKSVPYVPASEIYGSVSIVDNVASFGDNACIDLGTLEFSTAAGWSMEAEITTGNNVSAVQYIFAETGTSYNAAVLINGGKIHFNLSNSGHSSFLGSITSTDSIQANSTFKVKAEFTGTAYNLYFDGVSQGTLSNSTKLPDWNWTIGATKTGTQYPFWGTMNINETNVIIDGDEVFPSYKAEVNITEDCYTGQATEDIALNGTGDVTTVAKPIKYGASIDNFIGDVDSNGVLQEPTLPMDLVFNGVVKIDKDDVIRFEETFASPDYLQVVKSASFPDLEEVSGGAFQYAFYKSGIESVSFPKLKKIAFKSGGTNNYAFSSAFGENYWYEAGSILKGSLKTVSFPELEEIESGTTYSFNYAFARNPELTSVSFPKLKKINGSIVSGFGGYESTSPVITTTEMPALEEINNLMQFYQKSKITTGSFPSLIKMGHQALYRGFSGCQQLTSLSFPALKSTSFGSYTNQFDDMLSNCTGVTVHFPSNLQSVIGSWSSVTAGFSGANTTILYDLTATE